MTFKDPDRFDKLITALRTAVDNDGTLDKEVTSYNYIFDAFRLALKFYSFRDSSSEWYDMVICNLVDIVFHWMKIKGLM